MNVIYLSTEIDIKDMRNSYGYYSGKCYIKDEGCYPITDSDITERTKKYTSKGRAIKAAEAIYNKCGYVVSYKIEEI